MGTKLNIVTFNIRYDSKMDGDNGFFKRIPHIISKITRESPDVVCFQETQAHMLPMLIEGLPEYVFLGCGRDKNFGDEFVGVFYKRTKFDVMSFETFWLSDTPYVPGSRYKIQSPCPRTCAVAVLIFKEENVAFRVFNTHLDHESESAMLEGVRDITAKMATEEAKMSLPTFFVGDFNSIPNSETIAKINTNTALTLKDLTSHIDHTYHNFGSVKDYVKIDYIFATENIMPESVELWSDCINGEYLSDHYPVSAIVEIN